VPCGTTTTTEPESQPKHQWNHNHDRTRIPTKTSSSCLHVSPLPWTKQDISITGAYSFQRSCLPHSCDATCWQSPFLIHPHSSVCLVGLHQPPLHSRPIAQTIMADHNRQTAVDDAYLLTWIPWDGRQHDWIYHRWLDGGIQCRNLVSFSVSTA
jgi:hypothetical protein